MGSAKYRPLEFGVTRVVLREAPGAVRYLVADQALQPHAARMTDRLLHWAQAAPERTWMARRLKHPDGSSGDWRHISYAQALAQARSIAQALLNRGLSVEHPVAILSENDLEHALLALGCMLAGVPWCPVSPAYSTVSTDFQKLRHVLGTITPGLLFASDGARYGPAIAAAADPGIEVVLNAGLEHANLQRPVTPFADLLQVQATSRVDAATQATGPETIVKFLFTSGSTKLPKAVINTHRMWCANQQQMLQSMPVLREPPVLVDWLPWNHTFGGNHNFGLTLYNGGTLYIDDGKPVPALIHETLRNLRQIAPTVYFNVPTGFEQIAQAMETDADLRRTLLSRVRMFFYAGASLAQPIWDSLHRTQEAEIGERIVMGTGLGMTESGPFSIFITNPDVRAGDLGVPTPGLELKLVPVNGKTEVRYRGPNITPGYWRNPQASADALDEDGFFCTGDAVQWIDERNIHLGLKFDGRIAEDFKLGTGTFVSVGPMRARIIASGAPYIQDAVLTGINHNELGALIFPTQACRALSGLPADTGMHEVLRSAPVQSRFQQILNQLDQQSTGSASRVARACLMAQPPSIDLGEVTDKGSINQAAVLQHRCALVDALYDDRLPYTIKPQERGA